VGRKEKIHHGDTEREKSRGFRVLGVAKQRSETRKRCYHEETEKMLIEEALTEQIIGAAIEVHKYWDQACTKKSTRGACVNPLLRLFRTSRPIISYLIGLLLSGAPCLSVSVVNLLSTACVCALIPNRHGTSVHINSVAATYFNVHDKCITHRF
jgi:hypothetical protein